MSTIFGTFLWDRLVTALFAKNVFKAMLEQAKATTPKDFYPVVTSLGKALIGFWLLSTGNLLFIGIAWWLNKKYKAQQAEQELALIQ